LSFSFLIFLAEAKCPLAGFAKCDSTALHSIDEHASKRCRNSRLCRPKSILHTRATQKTSCDERAAAIPRRVGRMAGFPSFHKPAGSPKRGCTDRCGAGRRLVRQILSCACRCHVPVGSQVIGRGRREGGQSKQTNMFHFGPNNRRHSQTLSSVFLAASGPPLLV